MAIRPRLLLILWLGLLSLVVAVVTRVPLHSADFYTYLASGRLFFEGGKSLLYDWLSITHYSEPLYNSRWLFSFLVGLVDFGAGDGGIFVLRWLLFLSPVLIFSVCSFKKTSTVLWAALGLFFSAALMTRVQLRPEVLSYTFTLIFLWLTTKALAENNMKAADPLIWLLVPWANFHPTYYFGYVIYGAFICQHIKDNWDRGPGTKVPWRPVGLRIVAMALAGFVAPYPSTHLILFEAFLSGNAWAGHLTDFVGSSHFDTVSQVALLPLGALALFLFFRRQDLFAGLIVLVFGGYYFTMPKMFPHLALVLLSLVVWRGHFESLWQKRVGPKWALASALALTGAFQLSLQSYQSWQHWIQNEGQLHDPLAYPVHMADFMNDNDLGGNIYCEIKTCSYLQAFLVKPSRTITDIRQQTLFSIDEFEQYRRALIDPLALWENVENLKIDFIVAKLDWPERLADGAALLRNFQLIAMDSRFALFARHHENLEPATRLFLDPHCLGGLSLSGLSGTLESVRQMSAPSEGLQNLLQVALALKQNPEPERFSTWPTSQTVATHRLLAHHLLSQDRPEASLQFWGALGSWLRIRDLIGVAKAAVQIGDPETAEAHLKKIDHNYIGLSKDKKDYVLEQLDSFLNKTSTRARQQILAIEAPSQLPPEVLRRCDFE